MIYMHFKDKLKTDIPRDKIPGSYQIIGDVLLLKFMKIKKMEEKKEIAKCLMAALPYVKTVCEVSGISGEFRKPKVKKILGNGTETLHKEHGIKYKLDVKKIMFSKGNVSERKRLAKDVKKNEIVIDMFAGIGYFSLGLSRHAKKIYAIEKNKATFSYLKQNILLNNIKNIEPILADRVIMGYFCFSKPKTYRKTKTDAIQNESWQSFPGTESFLGAALRFVKKGGIIHFHNTYATHELWHKPEEDLKKYIPDFEVIEKRIVKSAGPHVQHVVLDVKVL
jgi:tRNA wybutosine-synthesizing protein 2